MITYPSKQVVREAAVSALIPSVTVTVAVDTAYVAARQGSNISQGIYMMDNMVRSGSGGEGTLELSTVAPVGSLIAWSVVPIDVTAAGDGTSIAITGFTVSQGNVFGGSGYPRPQTAKGDYWMGQLMNQGSQTYQIQIKVTVGAIQPVSYFINWDPFITAR